MKLVWSRLARTELLEAFTYIAERNYDAAVKVFENIEQRSAALMELPELGFSGEEPGTRELILAGTR
jgi:plasmid stabilization system protein ParE